MIATLPTMSPQQSPTSWWTWANLLTGLRFVVCLPLFVSLAWAWWWMAEVLLLIAAVSDWLDGWLARRTQTVTALGRNLDPLADKVLVCGSLVFLLPQPEAGVAHWMVAIIVIRELLITSLRSLVEQAGLPFGAALLGKLKMVLQMLALIAVVACLALVQNMPHWSTALRPMLSGLRDGLLWATVIVTLVSGLQYLARAYAVLLQD
ncbi:MAG: CDP-diacylglycerol--glycerol-3-phosphate 3-phosphatidyltransferase [Gemmatales bacterium]|nr:CDP-diacylglycerol--glycerol-3-phosphate 3-phosphatidyltransferase [Gemmatales bacterium]MDW8222103.1 CDP-diacylglycerol--glycerol-3-phosphate 3-phosphatidyltransferase [Gemmatales bacterium]